MTDEQILELAYPLLPAIAAVDNPDMVLRFARALLQAASAAPVDLSDVPEVWKAWAREQKAASAAPQQEPSENTLTAMKEILFSGRLVDTFMIRDLYRVAIGAAPQPAQPQDEQVARYAAKLEAVWQGIRDVVEKYSGKPCEGEPFDRLDELLASMQSAVQRETGQARELPPPSIADADGKPFAYSADQMQECVRAAIAAQPATAVPNFIVRHVQRAIDAATNPKGMHTNGPAMARVEASQLAALLRYAQAAAPAAPADHGSHHGSRAAPEQTEGK